MASTVPEIIRLQLQRKVISKEQALERLGEVLASETRKSVVKDAESLISEIIELPDEPKEMTKPERDALEQHYEAKQAE